MHLRIFAAGAILALLSVTLVACGGRSYSTTKGDNEYDLSSMRLTQQDVPAGMEEQPLPGHEFDNEQWSQWFNTEDFAAKQKQLDAQGRVTNYITYFQAQEFGKVLGVLSVSTLYKDEKAALDSERQYGCGLPLDDQTPVDNYPAPQLADGSHGFFVKSTSQSGLPLVDTTFCFRTGRILHAIQQTSLPGVEDVALNVRLAQSMLQHVNDAFDGKKNTEAEPTEPPNQPSPAGNSAPGAATTPAAGSSPAPAGSPTKAP